MKAGKEHRIPLSPRAVEILEAVKPLHEDWLFPGDKGGKLSGMAMAMLLRRMKVDCDGARLPLWLPRLGSRMHRLSHMKSAKWRWPM